MNSGSYSQSGHCEKWPIQVILSNQRVRVYQLDWVRLPVTVTNLCKCHCVRGAKGRKLGFWIDNVSNFKQPWGLLYLQQQEKKKYLLWTPLLS